MKNRVFGQQIYSKKLQNDQIEAVGQRILNALYLPPLLFRDMVNLESIEFHGADLKNEDLLNLPSGIKSIGFQETKILHGIDEIVIERFSELKNLTLNRSDSISFKSEFVHSVETLKIVDQVDFQDLLIKFPNLKHLMIRGGSTNCSELILKQPILMKG